MGGQALPVDSVVVDFSELNGLGPVDEERGTIRCQAGALLREVVAATLEHGLLPRVLTNLLDLTVGGLLSVGGIGPGSYLLYDDIRQWMADQRCLLEPMA